MSNAFQHVADALKVYLKRTVMRSVLYCVPCSMFPYFDFHKLNNFMRMHRLSEKFKRFIIEKCISNIVLISCFEDFKYQATTLQHVENIR